MPRIAIVVLLLLLIASAVAVLVITPHVDMYRFNQRANDLRPEMSLDAVLDRLGPEDQRWEREMKCVSCYPCTPSKQKGIVLFYRRGIGCGFDFGWYLYFDFGGRLVEIEGAST
jgi:hypothetical protein